MANYIDGFALPIPRDQLHTYKAAVTQVAEVWKEHGALDYFEYVGDDMELEGTRSYTDAVNAGEDEVVIFGWVVFDSKESRDRANQAVISDPRMVDLISPLIDPDKPIFNAGRMAYGGFRRLV